MAKPNKRFRERCRDLFHAYGKRVLCWDDLTNEDKGLLVKAWPNEQAPNAFERIVWDIATDHRVTMKGEVW